MRAVHLLLTQLLVSCLGGACYGETLSDGEDLPNEKFLCVLGVLTGYTQPGADARKDYALRRKAAREAWFPANETALKQWEHKYGMVVRFVIGRTRSPEQRRMLRDEVAHHGAFLNLPIVDTYANQVNKTISYFRLATSLYDADYFIKSDDDVFVRLDRLPAAITQWQKRKADYVGCFKTGQPERNPTKRYYEPHHIAIGNGYYAYAHGYFYVLQQSAAETVIKLQSSASLRFMGNEDSSVGAWMLALNVQHFDDRRTCEEGCSSTNLLVTNLPCAGLCDPVPDFGRLSRDEHCWVDQHPSQLQELKPVHNFPSLGGLT